MIADKEELKDLVVEFIKTNHRFTREYFDLFVDTVHFEPVDVEITT